MLEDFAVKDVAWLVAAQKLSQVSRHDGALVRENLEGVAAHMRRGDYIRKLKQRMIRARRLYRKHVHRRASKMPVPKRGDQRRLIDQGRTCVVDQVRAALHLRNLSGPEQRPRFVGQGRMQGDEIALGKELFQRNRLNIEEHGPFGRQEWIVGDDAHAKRLKALGHALPDGSKTDDADRLMPQLPPL